jgi:hypothetical protein
LQFASETCALARTPESMAGEVFISFVHEDRALAEEVCQALESGYPDRCWIASRNCKGGRDYRDEILGAIRSCKVMVLLNSEHTSTRRLGGNRRREKWVEREVTVADEASKQLLPVLVEGAALWPRIQLLFAGTQYIELYRSNLDAGLSKLREAVDEALQNQPSSFDKLLIDLMQKSAASPADVDGEAEQGAELNPAPPDDHDAPLPSGIAARIEHIDALYRRQESYVPPAREPRPAACAPASGSVIWRRMDLAVWQVVLLAALIALLVFAVLRH